jgi:geranylgeranyl diphosphate synthase, type I
MTSSPLATFRQQCMPELDAALRQLVARLRQPDDGLWRMACHAMGWQPDGAESGGKRIRPLLALLVAGAVPADWRRALPGACAVELIHAFSLVHDDIQDGSDLRRGRPAVWRAFGTPHAINAGDALFTMAFAALAEAPPQAAARMLETAADTCVRLTQGQYLDMAYEQANTASLAQYQEMIEGKTAALIEASCRLGAIAADAAPAREESFARFGHSLGLAFQAQDDFLGVWGNPAETGKSAASDLITRKKSLPILFGLQQSPVFQKQMAVDPLESNLPALLHELEACGAKQHTLDQAHSWTKAAFAALQAAAPVGECGMALEELAAALLERSR